MDAESTDIVQERRTRRHRFESAGDIDHLRSDMLETQDRIVEDVERLKEMLSPDRLASYLASALREELLVRIKTVDLGKLGNMREKITTRFQNNPYLPAFVGAGVSGLLIYGLMKYRKEGMSGYSGRKTAIAAAPEFEGPEYEYTLSEASAVPTKMSSLGPQFEHKDADPLALVRECAKTEGQEKFETKNEDKYTP